MPHSISLRSATFLLLACLIIVSAVPYPVSAVEGVQVLQSDADPVIVHGRTLVPVRVLSDWLGLPIHYDEELNAIFIGEGWISTDIWDENPIHPFPLALILYSLTAEVNGKAVEMDTPAIVWQGRTMIPLRFFAETFNVKVEWNSTTREILFNNNGVLATLYVPEQTEATTCSLNSMVDPILSWAQFLKDVDNGPGYGDLIKAPWKYVGQPVGYYGEVLQAREFRDGSTLLLVKGGGSIDKIFAVFSSGPVNLVENDKADFYGTVTDLYTYTTVSGDENTVPATILVRYAKL